jgi:hypothetical protein
MGEPAERRRSCRFTVRWPLSIELFGDGTAVQGMTENLNSRGFYCTVPEPAVKGQIVACVIRLPSPNPEESAQVYLHCRAEVLRVEAKAAAGGFGLGCRILDYHVRIDHSR